MKSKKKTKTKGKKKMFGGLNKLPPDLIKRIANQGNGLDGRVGAKLTGIAKLGLTNNNRVEMRKKNIDKEINKLNNLSKKKFAAYHTAIYQDRHDMAYKFLQGKQNIDKEINKLKKKKMNVLKKEN